RARLDGDLDCRREAALLDGQDPGAARDVAELPVTFPVGDRLVVCATRADPDGGARAPGLPVRRAHAALEVARRAAPAAAAPAAVAARPVEADLGLRAGHDGDVHVLVEVGLPVDVDVGDAGRHRPDEEGAL